jgi:hypothetical protein
VSVNALLIRWKHGYTQVGETAPPLKFGYLTLGSVETESEAKRIGGQELLRIDAERDQISLAADPNPASPANAYGTGWDVGDYVLVPTRVNTEPVLLGDQAGQAITDESGQDIELEAGTGGKARVLQVSLAEDDNAVLSILPDLSTLLEQQEVRMQRWLTRMADGTMHGSSAVASPIVTPEWVPGRRPGSTSQTFSWNPASTERTSPWTPEVAGRLAQMHMRRTGSLVGNTVVAFIVNGVTLDEGTIYDGAEEGVFGGSGVDFRPGDKLELQPTSIAGADNLTCRVIQTHYH